MIKNKIYFASDFHLGYHVNDSRNREKKILKWLDVIKKDAKSIYLIGDIFDFWFEYKSVIPKGCVRLLGKIAEITDSGVEINIIVGNHDLWMKDYLVNECGVKIFHKPIKIKVSDKTIFLGHGDGLGPGQYKFKFLKKVFKNKFCQWLFSKIHPNIALRLAHYWSKYSREHSESPKYLGSEKEFIEQFCKNHLKNNPEINFYIFGHRHLPLEKKINESCQYINTGDWINHCSYAVYHDEKILLKYL